jgi:hypothetical protein
VPPQPAPGVAGDPGGEAECGADGLEVAVVVGIEGQTELVPVVGQDEREVVDVEGLVLVGEADPAVQLRVAG